MTREKGFRKLGVTECAYLWDDVYVEIITDGRHLPTELLRLIFKLKPHDKILLITDSMSVAGTTAERGRLGNLDYIIEDGVCKLLDRSAFAGSIATADRLLKVCAEAGLDVVEAVRMGSENPAALFSLNKGKLQVGYDADIIITDEKFNVTDVFIGGEKKKCC
jgi:N-acetylglucosamine-6-phosphate deacetylase